MAPPNGVPPNNDNAVYMSTTAPLDSSNTTAPTQPVVCADCKQNQKDGAKDVSAAELKEAPNNNVQKVVPNPNPKSTDMVKKPLDDEDEEEEEADLIVPPDGGWGWVIAFASFMCNLVVDGTIFCFGMLLRPITYEFEVSEAQVSLVGSLLSGFYLLVGPFVSALANRYGFRTVAMVGSVISCAAFVLSYFATSVEYLYFTYGFLGGIGFGLIYVPAVIAVGFYFEKWRALATGIAVCGSGIGTFVLAPIFAKLVTVIGWRGSILVQAVMALSCILFGLLFRPLKPTKVSLKVVEQEEEAEMEREATLQKAQSVTSVHRALGVNSHYPTVTEVLTKSNMSLNKSTYSLNKRHSVHPITEEERTNQDENGAAPLLNETGPQPVIVATRKNSLKRQRTISECEGGVRSRRGTLTGGDTSRPLYRDDIFFGGSLARLPQYTSHTSLGYTMSVTRLPTQNDIDEEKQSTCKLCPESVRRTLATMLDFSLFTSPSFLLLALSGGLTMMGFYVPFIYLTARATENGMDDSLAMWLLSAIGICNTIGRIVCGSMSSFPKVNTLWVNNIALTVGGIVTMCSGISMSAEYQYLYSCVFGLAISCFASLRSILLVDLMGLERLTNAFGLCLLFQGVAAAVGAPMAGAFKDATGSYDASFYLSGALILISAIMCYPLNMINQWEKRRQKDVPV